MVADVEAAVGDDGVGPGFFHVVGVGGGIGRGEVAFLVETGRGGFDEGDITIFTVEVEIAFGKAECCRSGGVLLPFDVAGVELEAHQRFCASAVEVIAEGDGAADGGGELGRKISLLGGDFAIFEFEFHDAATCAG